MSRYLGTTALEWSVYQAIVTTDPILYRDNRGRPVIEVPNPDATWDAHPVCSPRVHAWIQRFYTGFMQGRMVLTKAEIERIALLLAGDAYVNAPPPLSLPFEPTEVHEPLLQCVVEFMLYAFREHGKTRFENNVTVLKAELLKAATRLGYPADAIPVAAWIGRRLRDLVMQLDACGIIAKFYLTDLKRFTILEWKAGKLPILDGKDLGLPAAVPLTVIPNPLANKDSRKPDGTDGNRQEPDWDTLQRKGDSES